jgi:tRNA pseudouridine55 synthase
MHSAIKRDGVPLYKLAHQGIEIEREPREVTIYELELLEYQADRLVFRTRCSKGTYVRTLAEEIGAALGCGAHITALERTTAGPFRADEMLSLEHLQAVLADKGFDALDQALVPPERALEHWPMVGLSENAAYYLRQGQAVFVPGVDVSGWVRLHEKNGRFIGMGIVQDDGRVAPKRLVNAPE